MTPRDATLLKLAKWAFETWSKKLKRLKPKPSGLIIVRLLSMEGVQIDLKGATVPEDLLPALTLFRRLRQDARLRKSEQLLQKWTDT